MNASKTNSSQRFLLAKFNVDYIIKFPTAGGIKEALSVLSVPETMAIDMERENERRMDKVYDRIVDSIRMQPRAIQKYAFRALSWIGYATRTLTIQELLVAISVEAKQYQLNDTDMLRLEDLLGIGNGLVVADEKAVRLVHFSVRNYLDRHQVIPEDAKEMYRAITCTTYLCFDIFKEQQCSPQGLKDFDSLRRSPSFLEYAAKNLSFHLSKVERRHYPETTSAVMTLLDNEGHRRTYYRALGGASLHREIPRLNLACAIGYEDAVRTLLEEEDVDVNAKDTTYGQTPLLLAARIGHEAVVKRLLGEDRLNRDCKDNDGRTPLSVAIRNKREGIVRLLLEKGVKVNFTYMEVSQSNYIRTSVSVMSCRLTLPSFAAVGCT